MASGWRWSLRGWGGNEGSAAGRDEDGNKADVIRWTVR